MFSTHKQPLDLTALNPKELISTIRSVNPDLANILNSLAADFNDCTFYKASYRFGSKIINNNICYLPLSNGESIAINDKHLPDIILKDLSYNPETEDPLAIILNKCSETYLAATDIIQPHGILQSGNMFGIPRAIDENPNNVPTSALSLNLNAGARSLFMLASIADQKRHINLQEHYKTKLSAPKSLQNHWQMFCNIANKADCSWRCEVIYFPRTWIKRLKQPDWAILHKCLTQINRASYNILHNNSAVWNNVFHEIEQKKALAHYSIQALTTAQHLFLIAAHSIPGFRAAINDNSAPVALLQEAYTKIYGLPKLGHAPIIMEPAILNSNADRSPVYYSINYQTFLNNNLEASGKKSHIALLDEIRVVQGVYIKSIKEHHKNVKSLYNMATNSIFSYYHSNAQSGYAHIHDALTIAESDNHFLAHQYTKQHVPINSQFFKGCIRIQCKS